MTAMRDKKKTLDVVKGSGNVFADFGLPDAGLLQVKALLAAEIVKALDEEGHTVRKAESLTKIAAADFSRLRGADLSRFTIDRLLTILNRLGRKVDVAVKVRQSTSSGASESSRELA